MDDKSYQLSCTLSRRCVLAWSSRCKLDPFGLECGLSPFGVEAAFTIDHKFFHGAMGADPRCPQSLHSDILGLVFDYFTGVKSRARVDKVNYHVLENEEDVCFNTLVESIWQE